MKTKSSKPKKQRKRIHSLALHEKQKLFSAHLETGLRKILGRRALEIKKGDKVKVLRGSHKKKSGKVTAINRDKVQVFIEKLMRKKSDGTEILIPFRPSNLMLIELDKNDSRRAKGIENAPSVVEKKKEQGKEGKESKEEKVSEKSSKKEEKESAKKEKHSEEKTETKKEEKKEKTEETKTKKKEEVKKK
jgi:large subunit ribosomal protein L24